MMDGTLFLAFDCYATSSDHATLKWAKLQVTESHEYDGHDYKNRVARLTAVSRWWHDADALGRADQRAWCHVCKEFHR